MMSEYGIIPEPLNVIISKVTVGEQKEDYHKDMNTVMSEQFIVTMFPIIKSLADAKGRPAALMLDNAPYHGRAISTPPTTTSRKADILSWLEDRNVPVSISESKPVLLNKLNRFLKENGGRLGNTVFYLDTEAAKYGVEIIRTPPSTDAAALYRHVDNYVDEIRDIVRQKEAEDADEKSDQECLDAGLFGDSSFDEVLESDVSEEF
uniref:Tc1-like transposase DDE domain-containing protein n=2 Tax=Caenorhabditis japonica TaxID=281687 RepID=A0A8R1HTT1_CAEJA